MDIEKRELKALTHGMRAGDPAFSPDGAEIVYVKNGKGEKSLAKLQLGRLRAFSPVSTAAGGEGTQYFSPSYSPDGKWLVAAKRLKNGDQKIIITRDRSGSEEVLIPGDENVSESNPSYSPDGEYILLDSDRSGIVNLYAFHLKSRRLYQLTNMAGGAMMPDLSPDGKKIAYISYSSRGYDVALLDVDVSSWKEVAFSESRTTKPNNDTGIVTLTKYPSHDYNPWPSLLPTFWIPYNYSNENGDQTSIYIGGSDPLMQHIYYLNLGYDFSARRPAYTFYYANNQFLPQITIGLSDSANLYSWSGSTYWERERDAIRLYSYTFNLAFT